MIERERLETGRVVAATPEEEKQLDDCGRENVTHCIHTRKECLGIEAVRLTVFDLISGQSAQQIFWPKINFFVRPCVAPSVG